MTWRLEPSSGPIPGPWEGKDVVSWVWEIYRGDEARRVLVEVTGTAMATAEEYLPRETAEARSTSGRSEVEKVLVEDDPPPRITLGSTGYLPDSAARPDFLLTNRAGDVIAIVEVKNPDVLTRALAAVLRDRVAPLGGSQATRFVLVLSQNSGFLFDLGSRQVRHKPLLALVTLCSWASWSRTRS